jgi:transcriptional regulator with XRE-family HTH domain
VKTAGERIKHARELKRWSRNRLDAEAGLSQGMTSRIERNERAGMGETIAKMAGALGVRTDWILSGTSPMEAEQEPSVDPIPHRAEAARLARADGVYELAVRAVLDEKPDEHALTRSVLWWADRMRFRQAELIGAAREAVRPDSAPESSVEKSGAPRPPGVKK